MLIKNIRHQLGLQKNFLNNSEKIMNTVSLTDLSYAEFKMLTNLKSE